MAYYQKIGSAYKTLKLNGVDSTKFPTTGGDYNCSTSNTAQYYTATNYYSGTTQIRCDYAGQYTITYSVTNPSYMKAYSVSRATSPERGATTGVITDKPSSGATAAIYRGDTLTITATAADTTYGSYNFSSLTAPTLTVDSSTQITVTNPNSVTCTVYMGTSSSSITTNKGSVAATGGLSIAGLTAGTTYYFTLQATPTRPKYTYSVGTKTLSSSTVAGDVTATFSASRSVTTESGTTVTSASASASTVAYKTITFKIAGTYASSYTGMVRCAVGSSYGDYGDRVWSYTVPSGTTSGSTLGTFTTAVVGTTYYFAGTSVTKGVYIYSVSASPTSSTIGSSNITVTFNVSRTEDTIECGCVRQGIQFD